MGLVHTSCRTTAIHCEWLSDESGHTRILEVKWSHIMETNILSAIRDRNIFWIVIFYYLYYKAPNASSVPGSITMRDFKNNCFKKEFSLISTEKKAIVDILVFGIILRCGYCPFRFHCCFYCYVMLVVFWSLKRGRKYFRNHHNTRSTNNDLKLIFWKKNTL